MQHNTKTASVPPAATWLGVFGAIPFVILAGTVLVGEHQLLGRAAFALLAYGAIILSFLGGIQWGMAIVQADANGSLNALSSELSISVAPALLGWIALFLPREIGFIWLAAAFGLVLVVDVRATRRALAPAWYPKLRWPLTLIVITSLVIAALSQG